MDGFVARLRFCRDDDGGRRGSGNQRIARRGSDGPSAQSRARETARKQWGRDRALSRLSAMRNESSQSGGTTGSVERGRLGRLMQRRFETMDVLTRRKAAGGY